jgi:D-alanyl-D-alanine-carboxypeptidase/D-alanyl-D-alanine-endopeptidase
MARKMKRDSMSKVTFAVAVALLFSAFGCQSSQKPRLTIAEILRECVDTQKRAPGIVVGLISEKGTEVVAYGKRERGKVEAVDGDTVFEIGSITKVFTTLLLQVMADQGELNLNDPIGKFLPASVKTPSKGGNQITLLDLATHTSGLPRLPENLSQPNLDNPYADYDVNKMYDFLSHYKLSRRIGAKYEYSNLGMGLLGHLLALKAGTNFESLIVSRICTPLHMDITRITRKAELNSRLATGHGASGPPVMNWDSLALQGDGALYSSVNDLLKFLATNMGRGGSALSASMAKTQVPLRRAALFDKVGLGWQIDLAYDLIWHNGGTGGYSSYIGFNRDKNLGVVILANEATSLDDLGLYLLGASGKIDRFKAPKQRQVVQIDNKLYDSYVGRYQFDPKSFMTVSREGDRLQLRLSGEQGFICQILPESETSFFLTAADVQAEFVKNHSGVVTGCKFLSHMGFLKLSTVGKKSTTALRIIDEAHDNPTINCDCRKRVERLPVGIAPVPSIGRRFSSRHQSRSKPRSTPPEPPSRGSFAQRQSCLVDSGDSDTASCHRCPRS